MASAASGSKNNVAIVFGANGVSGAAALQVFHESSAFAKIIAVSRRPSQFDFRDDSRIKFIAVDVLQSSIAELTSKLKEAGGAEATHAFHYAYIAKEDEMEMVKLNKELLHKALQATAEVAQGVKSFLLQTGYKYYGVHKGGGYLAPLPFKEDAARHQGPNFYYDQEDLLRAFCTSHSWDYIITRPNFVIGVAKGNFMNLAVSIALYAVVCKEEDALFRFPGNQISWDKVYDHSGATNNARFQEWASLNLEATRNRAFNIHDGRSISFKELWPKIANYFGVQLPPEDKAFTIPPPKSGVVVQVPVSKIMPEKRQKWQEIVRKYNLDGSAFDYATWEFLEFAVGRTWWDEGDMSQARSVGWDVTVDTLDVYRQTFDRMKELRMIPA